jgi:SAM-dependent methyltransferase
MRYNIALARRLIRLGAQIQASAVLVMSADDLIEFNRQQYTKANCVEGWSSDDVINNGLSENEKKLFENIQLRSGRILLLALGGGREAIYFAKMGFSVTGVDFIPEMVERAKKNALRNNVKLEGLVQNIDDLELPVKQFDVAWLSAAMYSSIPTRGRRIRMLKRVHKVLKPAGYFACQFCWNNDSSIPGKVNSRRKLIAWLTNGNHYFEIGDMLWGNVEFIHVFSSRKKILDEFIESGFDIIYLNIPTNGFHRGEALLQKSRNSTFRK